MLSQAERADEPLEHSPMTMHGPPTFDFKLLLAGYEAIPVDSYLASPEGRTLLVEQDGRYRLVDVENSGWTDLGPAGFEDVYDPRADPSAPLAMTDGTDLYNGWGQCFADFSADGRTFLHLDRIDDGGLRLVVRELDQGLRHELDPGPGVLSWARLLPGGDAVVVRMTVEGEGTATEPPRWPYLLQESIPCSEPPRLPEGAVTVTRVLTLDGREQGRRSDLYLPMGPGLVRPTEDGGFWWWRADLEQETRTPACKGHVLHVDPVTPRILALCDEQEPVDRDYKPFTPGRLRLEMFDERVDLGAVSLYISVPRVDHAQRFVGVQAMAGPLVVDLDQQRRIQLPPGGQVMAIAAGRALVQSERIRLRPRPMKVRIVDLESLATVHTFRARAASWSGPRGSGEVIAYGRRLIDMATAEVLGSLPDGPWAVTRDGRALLFDPHVRQPRGGRLPRGPLRWYEVPPR